jgi:hypothetical protein
MINNLGWDTLERRRLLNQSCMCYKVHQGCVDLNFCPEVCPLTRKSRLPNHHPFQHVSWNNDVFKFSFFPRTIVTRNNLPFNELPTNINAFKSDFFCVGVMYSGEYDACDVTLRGLL